MRAAGVALIANLDRREIVATRSSGCRRAVLAV